eukprot:192754_1
MNGHKNWRCGEIDEIVKDGNRILKINVLYEQDDDYLEVWIELDDPEAANYIAECGEQVKPEDMLKMQYFQPYFNLKKNGKNIDWIQKRFTACLDYIKREIKKMMNKMDISTLPEYLNITVYELYNLMLWEQIRGLVDSKTFEDMEKQWNDMYEPVPHKLKIM